MSTARQKDSTGSHGGLQRRAYERLFRHPPPDDLAWGEVRALLGAMAEVQEGRKGTLKAMRRGVMATFRAGRERELLSADERLEVQRFFERTRAAGDAPLDGGETLVVAIDRDGAQVYRPEMRAARLRHLVPFHAEGYPAQMRSSHSRIAGKRQPERLAFYKELARSLRGAERIVLLARGEGGGAALEALRAALERGHADIARRVIGARVMKGQRVNEDQLLVEAREFLAELD